MQRSSGQSCAAVCRGPALVQGRHRVDARPCSRAREPEPAADAVGAMRGRRTRHKTRCRPAPSAVTCRCRSIMRSPTAPAATIALVRLHGDRPEDRIAASINPGGPGVSGVDVPWSHGRHAASARCASASTSSASIRAGSGCHDRRCECNSDADDDRVRADPDVDYSPAGVAQTDKETRGVRPALCRTRRARSSWPTSAPKSVAKDHGSAPGGARRRQADVCRLCPTALPGSAVRGSCSPNGCVPWCSTVRSIPPSTRCRQSSTRPTASQKAFDDYAADCAKAPDCPLGTDPTKAVERFHALVDPLVDEPAQTDGPTRPELQRRVERRPRPALYTPDHWEQLTAALAALREPQAAPTTCLKLADDVQPSRCRRTLRQSPRRVQCDWVR